MHSTRSHFPRARARSAHSITAAVARFGALALLAAAARSQNVSVRVQSSNDLYTPIAGEYVSIEGASNTWMSQTNSVGHTLQASFAPWDLLSVTLGETMTPEGVTLGQRRYVDVSQYAWGVGDRSLELELFAPVAVPMTIQSGVLEQYPTPHHARFHFFKPDPSASYNFKANVGMLLTAKEIQAYAAYYGLQFAPNDDTLGIVVRTTGANVGMMGLGLSMNIDGHLISAPPLVTPYLVSQQPSASNLRVQDSQIIHGRLFTLITGTFQRGDNLFLVSRTKPFQIANQIPLVATPPSVGAFLPTVKDCDPTPPTPPTPWTCDVPKPKSTCPSTSLASNCSTQTKPVDSIKCGTTGDNGTSSVNKTITGSISITLNAQTPGQVFGGSLQVTGEYSVAYSTSFTWAFEAGANGCGQCKQAFTHALLCATKWRAATYTTKFIRDPHDPEHKGLILVVDDPCGKSYEETTKCTDTKGPSITVCDRTCN